MADLFITPDTLAPLLGTPEAPVLVDARTAPDTKADPTRLPAAVVAALDALPGVDLPPGPAVVYCQKGGKISQLAAALLRRAGRRAVALQGGHLGWVAAGLPVIDAGSPVRGARWVMPAEPTWAELSSLWLLRRWIDSRAAVLPVARDACADAARVWNAQVLPDTPAALADRAGLAPAPDLPEAGPALAALLAGRLRRGAEPEAALDLVDDLRAGRGLVA